VKVGILFLFNEDQIKEIKIKLANKEVYSNKVKEYLLSTDKSIKDIFAIAINELTSQMYGPFLQKLIMNKNELISIPSSLNKGDAKTRTDKFYEIKCGQVNKNKIKLFQVRPYQEIAGYITVHYHAETDELFSFLIPHLEMAQICSEIKCSSHGAGEYKNEEKQVELDIYNLRRFRDFKINFEDLRIAIR
jgi:hypothetical protein